MDMADESTEKKSKKTRLVQTGDNKVKFVPPGKFKGPFTKEQQLGKSKAPKGGRR